jgi:hypothetical protein
MELYALRAQDLLANGLENGCNFLTSSFGNLCDELPYKLTVYSS